MERYMEFSLGNEDYIIPLLEVREVISIPETTPIPNMPSYYKGIMNLRGQVVSIIDFRKKMNIKANSEKSEEAVMIVEINDVQVGLIVDSINKVLTIDKSEINELPDIDTKMQTQMIEGVYHKDEKLIMVINLIKALGGELSQYSRAMAA